MNSSINGSSTRSIAKEAEKMFGSFSHLTKYLNLPGILYVYKSLIKPNWGLATIFALELHHLHIPVSSKSLCGLGKNDSYATVQFLFNKCHGWNRSLWPIGTTFWAHCGLLPIGTTSQACHCGPFSIDAMSQAHHYSPFLISATSQGHHSKLFPISATSWAHHYNLYPVDRTSGA